MKGCKYAGQELDKNPLHAAQKMYSMLLDNPESLIELMQDQWKPSKETVELSITQGREVLTPSDLRQFLE